MGKYQTLIALAASASLLIGTCVLPAAYADEAKPAQVLKVDMGKTTGDFLGGASGTLYGLGDEGSPTDAILDGARVENSSQKPPTGSQHPSGDALALERQSLPMEDENWPYTCRIITQIGPITMVHAREMADHM